MGEITHRQIDGVVIIITSGFGNGNGTFDRAERAIKCQLTSEDCTSHLLGPELATAGQEGKGNRQVVVRAILW